MNFYDAIHRAARELHQDGVSVADCQRFEQDAVNVWNAAQRARREAEAARLLHIGADMLATRQGCHRSTVYRRAERCRKNRKNATNQ